MNVVSFVYRIKKLEQLPDFYKENIYLVEDRIKNLLENEESVWSIDRNIDITVIRIAQVDITLDKLQAKITMENFISYYPYLPPWEDDYEPIILNSADYEKIKNIILNVLEDIIQNGKPTAFRLVPKTVKDVLNMFYKIGYNKEFDKVTISGHHDGRELRCSFKTEEEYTYCFEAQIFCDSTPAFFT